MQNEKDYFNYDNVFEIDHIFEIVIHKIVFDISLVETLDNNLYLYIVNGKKISVLENLFELIYNHFV